MYNERMVTRRTLFLLTISPDPRKRLLIRRWIPICSLVSSVILGGRSIRTRIKENQAIGPNQVDAASSRLTAQEKYKLFPVRIVELIDKFLSFRDAHCATKSETAVSVRVRSMAFVLDKPILLLLRAAQVLE